MQKLVFTNGNGLEIDLTSGNFGITNWAGLSNTPLNIQTQQVPFEDGGVFLDALMEQREIELTVAIYDGNNLELRYQKKRELISALNPKAGEGVLVYTNDYLTKQIRAVPQLPIFENKNSNDSGTLKASVVFSCPSPYWEDVNETEIVLHKGYVTKINNNGDVPAQVEINISGDFTNPVISNFSQNKRVKINDTVTNFVNINTKNGEKSVVTGNYSFEYLRGGSYNSVAGNGEITVYVGASILIEEANGSLHIAEAPYFSYLYDIIYHNNTFMAVGYYKVDESNRVPILMSSTDGENWERSALSSSGSAEKIIYGNGIYLVKGFSNIYRSTDRENWTVYTQEQSINDIVFGNNIFVLVMGYTSTKKIKYSSDGITWTEAEGVTISSLSDCTLTYGNDIFALNYYGSMLTSSNGIDWTERQRPEGAVSYCNDSFIIINSTSIYRSYDCIVWNHISTVDIGYTDNFHPLRYVNQRYIYAYRMMSSYDLINWQIIVKPFSNTTFIKNIDGIIFTARNYSTDGFAEDIQSYGSLSYITDIIKVNNLYYATTQGGIYTSTNLTNWQSVSQLDYTTSNIEYYNGIFIVCGSGFISRSTDGLNWDTTFYDNRFIFYEVSSGNGVFVVVGRDGSQEEGVIYVSSDGITWTEALRLESYEFYYFWSVAFGNGVFVATAYTSDLTTGYMYTSTDGLNWEIINYGSQYAIRSVRFLNNSFLGVGYESQVIQSSNGTEWSSITDFSGANFVDITYGKGSYFCIASSGSYFEVLVLFKSYVIDEINLISKLDSNSDMSLGLALGENKVKFDYDSGNGTAIIRYRQKYIGV